MNSGEFVVKRLKGWLEKIVMRIEREEDRVVGYVDYNGKGERDVISLFVGDGTVEVGYSVCLPVKHKEAKLVLACFNAAFNTAEAL